MQALGCLLYLLIYGRLPFAAEAKLQILNGDYSLPEGPSVAVVNLIRDLLQARRRSLSLSSHICSAPAVSLRPCLAVN